MLLFEFVCDFFDLELFFSNFPRFAEFVIVLFFSSFSKILSEFYSSFCNIVYHLELTLCLNKTHRFPNAPQVYIKKLVTLAEYGKMTRSLHQCRNLNHYHRCLELLGILVFQIQHQISICIHCHFIFLLKHFTSHCFFHRISYRRTKKRQWDKFLCKYHRCFPKFFSAALASVLSTSWYSKKDFIKSWSFFGALDDIGVVSHHGI